MNERIDDLVLLATLGELGPDEQDELDRAMAADPALAAEVRAELEVAAALLSSTPVRAPSTLRSSVLAAIAETPQSDGDDVSGVASGVDRSADDPVDAPAAPVVSLDRARERRRRLAPILSAAAAVVVLAVGAVLVVGGDDVSQYDEIAQADDAEQRMFDGELAQLEVVYSNSRDALVIAGDDVPEPGADRIYVLWAIAGDDVRPIAEFRPDGSGSVSARVDGVDARAVTLGITAEPTSGYETPTLPILGTA